MQQLGQRLVYGVVRVAETLARALAPAVALRLGDGIGLLWWALDRRRRRRADANLRLAVPDADASGRRALSQAAFRHMARVPFEFLLAPRLLGSRDAIQARITPEGDIEPLLRLIDEGQPALIWTGHLGNWEVAGHVLRTWGVTLSAVARPIENPFVDRHVRAERGGPHAIIPHHGALPRMTAALRRGRWLGVVGDQNAGRNGTFVPFFGVKASTHVGPLWLAVREQVPLIVGACIRDPQGHRGDDALLRYRLVFRLLPLPPRDADGATIQGLLEEATAWLEDQVRAHPRQYNWLHRRWKSKPRGEVDGRRPQYDHHRPPLGP